MADLDVEVKDPAPAALCRRDQPGWDALLEDIFGLSLRGLATIRDMLLRPAEVFTAARAQSWLNRYTPSLRLVMSLIAVMLLLRIFWAAESTAMFQMVLVQIAMLQEQGIVIEDPMAMARLYFNAWAFVFPFAYLIVHALFALLTRVWGKGTSTVVRLRLYFAAMIPGIIYSVLFMAAAPFQSATLMMVMTFVSMGITFLLHGLTCFRGMMPVMSAAGRLWRGGLFAAIATTADIVASILASTLGGVAIGYVSQGGQIPVLD